MYIYIAATRQLHWHYLILRYTIYNYNYNYATLHYIRFHFTTLHCTTLHYIICLCSFVLNTSQCHRTRWWRKFLRIMDGSANPLMVCKVVGVVFSPVDLRSRGFRGVFATTILAFAGTYLLLFTFAPLSWKKMLKIFIIQIKGVYQFRLIIYMFAALSRRKSCDTVLAKLFCELSLAGHLTHNCWIQCGAAQLYR